LPLPIKVVAASGLTANGTYTLNTNGSFSYTPTTMGYVGADTFQYQVTDGDKLSSPATVTISLSNPTPPTLSTIDNFDRTDSTSLVDATHPWSQVAGNVTTVPDLRIVGNEAAAVTTELGGLAIWNQTFGATQYAGFSGTLGLKNSALVLKATGTDPAAPVNYVRVRCEDGAVVVATMMGGSGVSIFAKQAAFSAPACTGTGPLSAVVDAKGLVTVFLSGDYVGGVQLPDVPAWKGPGRIGIQLQTVGATVDNFSGGEIVEP